MPNRMQSLLRGTPRDELHTPGNDVGARVFNQKMNVVGRHHIIEHAQTKAFLRLENPVQVTASILPSIKPLTDNRFGQ